MTVAVQRSRLSVPWQTFGVKVCSLRRVIRKVRGATVAVRFGVGF
ncbi:hypothetical protein EDD75_0656 [Thermodesulfitimonas autotrophica]|uniref:Uncharacterized protein n=1 Tax=Thermodesulfitimonas autotrophica TaxID=1894989 RepID=A0A3N5C0Z9_9THEO|nr:hypothetical protein EDD75_0656 [Thermodesulfitimonas autotrophica]